MEYQRKPIIDIVLSEQAKPLFNEPVETSHLKAGHTVMAQSSKAMESQPTVLERAHMLAELDRRTPEAVSQARQLIDAVSRVELTDGTESTKTSYRIGTDTVIAFGRSIDYLKSRNYRSFGAGEDAELAGWMTAGVAAEIAAEAHEATADIVVAPDERLRLRHALATFAGLRETWEGIQTRES